MPSVTGGEVTLHLLYRITDRSQGAYVGIMVVECRCRRCMGTHTTLTVRSE